MKVLTFFCSTLAKIIDYGKFTISCAALKRGTHTQTGRQSVEKFLPE